MFVKSPQISPFPEQFFFSQSGNSTEHKLDFKGICLACSGCHETQTRWHRKGKESFEEPDLVREPGSQWSRENWNSLERTLCLLGTANAPQEGTGTSSWLPPG